MKTWLNNKVFNSTSVYEPYTKSYPIRSYNINMRIDSTHGRSEINPLLYVFLSFPGILEAPFKYHPISTVLQRRDDDFKMDQYVFVMHICYTPWRLFQYHPKSNKLIEYVTDGHANFENYRMYRNCRLQSC